MTVAAWLRRFAWLACLTALAALPLAACTILPAADVPPPRLFVLSPKTTFSAEMRRTDRQLAIDVPLAEAGLNTARIALRHDPLSLEYFERANWIDTAPRMIQTLMVESFENSRGIMAVARTSAALRADYALLSELREFQAEYDGAQAPLVRVRINLKLVKMPQRVIVGATTIERVAKAAGTRLEDVVAAFDDALGKVLRRVVEWTLTMLPVRAADSARP